MAREFKDFVAEKMTTLNEADDDWFARRLAQFQAASAGQKGAITDDRTQPGKYVPPPAVDTPAPQKPIQWVKMSDGWYEQMTPEDEADGLSTLSRWNTPAWKSKAYYTQRKDGRWIIVRPNARGAAANRNSM